MPQENALRILYIAPHRIWPLTTGARLRNYHLARQLANRAHVTYFGISQPGETGSLPSDREAFTEIIHAEKDRGYTAGKLVKGFIGPVPVTVLNYTSRTIVARLTELLAKHRFDSIQIEGLHLSGYLPILRTAQGRPAVLADWHNIESELMSRYAANTSSLPRKVFARRTAKLMIAAEEQLLKTCDATCVVSERERDVLARQHPGCAIDVIPNGVDVSHYRDCRIPGQSGKDLIFVGSMDYHANIEAVEWFLNGVWPLVSGRLPDSRFVVVGRNPPESLRKRADDRVIITGTVDDVRPFYQNALAAVVPLHTGSGTRLKILESLAAGAPVISTRLGSEGIEVVDGAHLLHADSAADMAAAIESVARSPELASRLAAEGCRLALEKYDWSIISDKLYAVHARIAERSRTAAR